MSGSTGGYICNTHIIGDILMNKALRPPLDKEEKKESKPDNRAILSSESNSNKEEADAGNEEETG